MLAYVYCRMTRYNCIARKLDFMDRPTSTRDNLEQFHHISCAFLRVWTRQWKGFCRAAIYSRQWKGSLSMVNDQLCIIVIYRSPLLAKYFYCYSDIFLQHVLGMYVMFYFIILGWFLWMKSQSLIYFFSCRINHNICFIVIHSSCSCLNWSNIIPVYVESVWILLTLLSILQLINYIRSNFILWYILKVDTSLQFNKIVSMIRAMIRPLGWPLVDEKNHCNW